MKKTLFLLLIFPILISCSSDDNEFNLKGSKWSYVSTSPDGKYYWEDVLEFVSDSECTLNSTTNYDEYYYESEYEAYEPIPKLFTYNLSGSNIILQEKDGDSNLQAKLDLKTNSITISYKVFMKE